MRGGSTRFVLVWLLAAAFAVSAVSWSAVSAAEETDSLPSTVFAIIDGERVGSDEFASFVNEYARQTYYHGSTTQDSTALRSEAGEEFIRLRLLGQEARRRGLAGDPETVERELEAYAARFEGTKLEPRMRKELPRIRQQLLDNSRIIMLRDEVRRVEDPAEDALASFYRDNIALFTEPARNRLALILIGVPPWAEAEDWDAAEQRAADVAGRLREEADFAEMARLHSDDASASAGGDLGAVHEGNFSGAVRQELDKLDLGETTPPVRVLEGYAIFRLLERLPSRVRAFHEVRERATALYKRERAEQKWVAFMSDLRAGARVVVNESLLAADQE